MPFATTVVEDYGQNKSQNQLNSGGSPERREKEISASLESTDSLLDFNHQNQEQISTEQAFADAPKLDLNSVQEAQKIPNNFIFDRKDEENNFYDPETIGLAKSKKDLLNNQTQTQKIAAKKEIKRNLDSMLLQKTPKKRFCSLFAIFGLNHRKFIENSGELSFEIIGTYPDIDKNVKVGSEHKFTQDLRNICFPEIPLKVELFDLTKQDPLCRPSFFHFIATNDLAERQYLTSVNFKELMLCEQGAYIVPKAICVASSMPIFGLQKQVLLEVFRRVILTNNNVSIEAYKQAVQTNEGYFDQFNQPPSTDYPSYVFKYMNDVIMCSKMRRSRSQSRNSASPKSSKNSSSSPRDAEKGKKSNHNLVQSNEATVFKGVNNVGKENLGGPLVDFTPILELYITFFCKHLYLDVSSSRDIQITRSEEFIQQISTSSKLTSQNTLPMNQEEKKDQTTEKINNQMLKDKKAEQNVKITKNKQVKVRHIPMFTFRNKSSFGFQLENYNFDILLQTVKPEKVVQLFTAILFERKVVLIKKEIGDIAILMQSLITLLSPFTWNYTMITYLSQELVDMLDAPFPFLIGVSSETWDQICTFKEYAEDIMIFDLETQERKFIPKFDLPVLPSPFGDTLLAQFREVIDMKDRRLEALRAENRNISRKQLDSAFEEQYWADAQLSVKQLFFNFLLETVNDYTKFLKKYAHGGVNGSGGSSSRLYQEKNSMIRRLNDNSSFEQAVQGTFDTKMLTSEDFFDFEAYLDWQKSRKNDENYQFVKSFVNTQSFHKYIEQLCLSRKAQEDLEVASPQHQFASSQNSFGSKSFIGAVQQQQQNQSVSYNDAYDTSAADFFEMNLELLANEGLKKVKLEQQVMIDQAKMNLAKPVKLKFNGILAKYIEKLVVREKKLRAEKQEQEERSPERFVPLFESLSRGEQLDDIVMRYIFMRQEEVGVQAESQFSMVRGVRSDLVLDQMPTIDYKLCEIYWSKIYNSSSALPSQKEIVKHLKDHQKQQSQVDNMAIQKQKIVDLVQMQTKTPDQKTSNLVAGFSSYTAEEPIRIVQQPKEVHVKDQEKYLANKRKRKRKLPEYEQFLDTGTEVINDHFQNTTEVFDFEQKEQNQPCQIINQTLQNDNSFIHLDFNKSRLEQSSATPNLKQKQLNLKVNKRSLVNLSRTSKKYTTSANQFLLYEKNHQISSQIDVQQVSLRQKSSINQQRNQPTTTKQLHQQGQINETYKNDEQPFLKKENLISMTDSQIRESSSNNFQVHSRQTSLPQKPIKQIRLSSSGSHQFMLSQQRHTAKKQINRNNLENSLNKPILGQEKTNSQSDVEKQNHQIIQNKKVWQQQKFNSVIQKSSLNQVSQKATNRQMNLLKRPHSSQFTEEILSKTPNKLFSYKQTNSTIVGAAVGIEQAKDKVMVGNNKFAAPSSIRRPGTSLKQNPKGLKSLRQTNQNVLNLTHSSTNSKTEGKKTKLNQLIQAMASIKSHTNSQNYKSQIRPERLQKVPLVDTLGEQKRNVKSSQGYEALEVQDTKQRKSDRSLLKIKKIQSKDLPIYSEKAAVQIIQVDLFKDNIQKVQIDHEKVQSIEKQNQINTLAGQNSDKQDYTNIHYERKRSLVNNKNGISTDEISDGENDMTIFEEGSNVIDTLPVDEGSAAAIFKNHSMEFRSKFNQIPQSMQPNFGHRQVTDSATTNSNSFQAPKSSFEKDFDGIVMDRQTENANLEKIVSKQLSKIDLITATQQESSQETPSQSSEPILNSRISQNLPEVRERKEKKKLKSTLSELLGKPTEQSTMYRHSLGVPPKLRSSITFDSRYDYKDSYKAKLKEATNYNQDALYIRNPNPAKTTNLEAQNSDKIQIKLAQNDNTQIDQRVINSCTNAQEETKVEELADGWFQYNQPGLEAQSSPGNLFGDESSKSNQLVTHSESNLTTPEAILGQFAPQTSISGQGTLENQNNVSLLQNRESNLLNNFSDGLKSLTLNSLRNNNQNKQSIIHGIGLDNNRSETSNQDSSPGEAAISESPAPRNKTHLLLSEMRIHAKGINKQEASDVRYSLHENGNRHIEDKTMDPKIKNDGLINNSKSQVFSSKQIYKPDVMRIGQNQEDLGLIKSCESTGQYLSIEPPKPSNNILQQSQELRIKASKEYKKDLEESKEFGGKNVGIINSSTQGNKMIESIASPNMGILFSHSSKRSQLYN